MAEKWYIWVDQVPAEWATKDVPGIFAGEGNPDDSVGWLPLVICNNEAEADAVVDAIEVAASDLIQAHGLMVYRNPLSDQKPSGHRALIVDTVNQLARLTATRGHEASADCPPLFLAARAIELLEAVRTAGSDVAPTGLSATIAIAVPATTDPWSKPDLPSQWAKSFHCSVDTLKRRIEDGTLRVDKVTSKKWRVYKDDLPKTAK